jgi:CRP/FNR family cyclic AMP-dependent transcriptional regulator
MRKVLFILGQLNDDDVAWLAQNGTRSVLADGQVLVQEGQAVESLFITLDGRLRVTLRDGLEVAQISVGEVIGEIAFVDAAPPSATVTAVGEAIVLALSKPLLLQRLESDFGFAARFYRALAIFLADRLRATTRRLGYGGAGDLDRDAVLEDELDLNVLDNVSQAGERFSRLLLTLQGGAQR